MTRKKSGQSEAEVQPLTEDWVDVEIDVVSARCGPPASKGFSRFPHAPSGHMAFELKCSRSQGSATRPARGPGTKEVAHAKYRVRVVLLNLGGGSPFTCVISSCTSPQP